VELILKTQNIAKWRFDEDLADLKKPVDKTKWNMSPQTKRLLQPVLQ
jgi:predicted metalloendopeptidase